MSCESCIEYELKIKDLEQSLKVSQSRAVNAIRTAAKLKVDLDQKLQENAEFVRRVNGVEIRETEIKQSRQESDVEMREMNYRNKCLCNELAECKSKLREIKLKSKARLFHTCQSLEDMENMSKQQMERVKNAANSIQSSVLDLQRHVGSQGFHLVNSHTAKALMQQLWDSCGKLCLTAETIDDKNDYKNEHVNIETVTKEAHRSALLLAAKNGDVQVLGESQSDQLFNDLTSLCSELENQNKALIAQTEDLKAQMKGKETQESRVSSIIPKYRMAILKARAEAKSVVEELKGSELTIVNLKETKNRQSAEMEKLLKTVVEKSQIVSTLEYENRMLESRIQEFQHADLKRKSLLETLNEDRRAFALENPARFKSTLNDRPISSTEYSPYQFKSNLNGYHEYKFKDEEYSPYQFNSNSNGYPSAHEYKSRKQEFDPDCQFQSSEIYSQSFISEPEVPLETSMHSELVDGVFYGFEGLNSEINNLQKTLRQAEQYF